MSLSLSPLARDYLAMSLFCEATLSCGKHIYAWLVSTLSSYPPHLRITSSLVLYCSTDLSLLSPHLYAITVLSRFVMFTLSTCSLLLALATPIFGAPTGTSFQQQNGLDAQKLNAQFATLKSTDSCTGKLSLTSTLVACLRPFSQKTHKPVWKSLLLSAWAGPGNSPHAPPVPLASHFLS